MSFGITASRRGKVAGGLVSAFGSALYGSHRGPRGFYPEPVDVWLAVLMDAVPLYQKSVIICPSTISDDRASSLLVRAKEHLPSVHLAPLRKRSCRDSSLLSCERSRQTSEVVAPLLPSFESPLESLAPQSLDLVVFAANVFGEELLYDAPWHMSLAHRCLRPHGVVAIIGYDTRVRVAAPQTAQRDTDDFLEDLQRRASELANGTDSQDISIALKRALDVSSSLNVGHADTYFPFPSTRRRWFVSEYSVSPAQLAASYRVLPEYQILSAGRRRHILPFSDGEEREGDAINVCRRSSCVDPLEALQVCLKAHDTLEGRRALASPSLRAHVRHFVVTCSARSVNSFSQHHELSSSGRRLPQLK
ncbi:uncharacterized protein TM35_000044690 [Trypanosoma theileri]|uniref:Methyltransferase type 11 domain-containing protein n=1 Tax=Trypanosoma theileri TaxID=67003 RepID=A0A1X0P5V1_9TRYP|nr:uncharacterized protein TM35_000044690 [Trypanosoma theileri]ORC92255.1 hypothetical protein TM35_000044690 [Trypanosoma theileri]